MKTIKIVYIDDEMHLKHSDFFNSFTYNDYEIEYVEIEFKEDYTYQSLITNNIVRNANIIVIDSKLYIESKANIKFTGEEFKLLLKKDLPYIKTIIISQNIPLTYGVLSKSDDSLEELEKILIENIEEINVYSDSIDSLKKSGSVDRYMIDSIEGMLSGDVAYTQLTTEDVDKLIETFNQLRSQYDK